MSRKTITVVNHYDMLFSNHGGPIAIKQFYYALSAYYDINIVMFVKDCKYYRDVIRVNEYINVFPIQTPASKRGLKETIMEVAVEDTDTLNRLRKITAESFMVIAEHVYTWNLIKKVCQDKLLVYRSHNVEYDFEYVGSRADDEDALQLIYNTENDACNEADYVLTISEEDKKRLIELYHVDASREKCFVCIKAGVASDRIVFTSPSDRQRIADEVVGFYIASKMKSAKEVVDQCLEVARVRKDVRFVIAGAICEYFERNNCPQNVEFLGFIEQEEKDYYMGNCDFAVNVVEKGSGLNIKMLEYFAYGIPVITSRFGVRGIPAIDGRDCLIVKNSFEQEIDTFIHMSIRERDFIALNARKMLDATFSWDKIAKDVATVFDANGVEARPVSEEGFEQFLEDQRLDCLKDKKIYIRCAGAYGKGCYRYLIDNGYTVENFIDDGMKDTYIDDVLVISESDFWAKNKDAFVIIAKKNPESILTSLFEHKIQQDCIAIYDTICKLLVLNDKYAYPKHLDRDKILQLYMKQ